MRLLYTDIDTLRSDHLGCAGYHRNTTPNIDLLAADGVRFENVYASDVPCLPSRTALITSAYSHRRGGFGHDRQLRRQFLAPWRAVAAPLRHGKCFSEFRDGCQQRGVSVALSG